METFYVSVDINEARGIVGNAVINGSISGELLDTYTIDAPGGNCFVSVYEKHYLRAGNTLTLTVVFDNFTGSTRVHCTGGGGGRGLFGFDWGASLSFEDVVIDALAPYMIKER